MHTLAILIAFTLFTWVLATLLTYLGARWVRVDRPTFRRAFLIVLTLWVVSIPFLPASFLLSGAIPSDAASQLVAAGGLILLQAVVNWFLIGWIAKTSLKKAIIIWFVGPVCGAICALSLMFLVMKPFVIEAFVTPSNNMSPTIKGWHHVGTCERCKGSVTIPASQIGRASCRERV